MIIGVPSKGEGAREKAVPWQRLDFLRRRGACANVADASEASPSASSPGERVRDFAPGDRRRAWGVADGHTLLS